MRDHINKIVDYLSGNFINETEIGLFDYKFYNRTMNEIFYLSKIFEEESAAFNFTLDESYMIKLHIKAKLQELRITYEKFPETAEKMSHVIFSIAYLNGLLGDLHYFDQEYDDAIIAYSDVLRPIKSLDVLHLNTRDFILMLRYKLKLGLTFEKIKSYEESLAFYIDASQDANRFVANRITSPYIEENLTSQSENQTTDSEPQLHFVSSFLGDLLQVINQPFIAIMVIQEKMGVEGITAKKSAITMGNFLQLSYAIEKKCGKNTMIIANFFLQVGKLLYYKNSSKAFEWDHEEAANRLPEEYRNDIKNLRDYHDDLLKSHTRRIPLMAMNMYFIGLKHTLEGRILTPSPFKFKFSAGETIAKLLSELKPEIMKQHVLSLSKSQYKYMAHFLSNIGDCMLGMLKLTLHPGFASLQVKDVADQAYLDKAARGLRKRKELGEVKAQELQHRIAELKIETSQVITPKRRQLLDLLEGLKVSTEDEYSILEKLFPTNDTSRNTPSFPNIILYYYLAAYNYRARRPRV